MWQEEAIELIEPTAELSGSEAVTRRTLYTARTFEVLVDPYIEDYSYEEARNFVPTGLKIGDMVGVGNIIYRANILALDPQIEKLTEKLAELQESYAEYYYETRTKLNDQYWELKVWRGPWIRSWTRSLTWSGGLPMTSGKGTRKRPRGNTIKRNWTLK